MTLVVILMFASMAVNMLLAARVTYLSVNPLEKVVYKEVEVVKKAMCECGHVSSVHNGGRGGCKQQLFKLDGKTTQMSYVCYCTKYTGPLPITEYFDDQLRELESHRA